VPRDLDSYQRFNRWFAQRSREIAARDAHLQAQRHKPIRRTGPAPQWHPDSYAQPGEAE